MKKLFYIATLMSWIAIICSLLGSLLLFVSGAVKTYFAYNSMLFNKVPIGSLKHLDAMEIATYHLIKALDSFLVAFVLFIFAYGVFTLFISSKETSELGVLKWIKTPNIGHLKNILGQVIIIILFVKFLEFILIKSQIFSWETLVLPIAILLLSMGLRFLRLGNDPKK